ncbi:hypothetical protein [Nocardia jiangsuensis]|uniref:Uncharacterized protein n=1 Tax=Nocardia jiangsuensis TaxID=1691563 RepID=A0ABV8DTS7_9NOCA
MAPRHPRTKGTPVPRSPSEYTRSPHQDVLRRYLASHRLAAARPNPISRVRPDFAPGGLEPASPAGAPKRAAGGVAKDFAVPPGPALPLPPVHRVPRGTAVVDRPVAVRNRFDPGPVPIAVPKRSPAPIGRATGGEVAGPGSSVGDKIPAWLSDGEFVVNARSTAMNRPFLQALNADPFFLQKMLAARTERGRSGAEPQSAAPAGQPATVNISMSNDEDIIGRLKVLAMQWELSH